MKRWMAVLLVLAGGSLSGCRCCSSCPGDCVPVSLEGCHDFVNHFGRCYYHFPYSCPPCPYYSGVHNGYQVHSEYDIPSSKYAPVPDYDAEAGPNPAEDAENDEVPPIPEPENN